MSSIQNLRQFVNDRLAAAAEEIFGVFQLTVSELENELDRHRKLLDTLPNQPLVLLPTRDVQVSIPEDSPQQQECRPSLDLEQTEPPHNKDVKMKSEDGAQGEEEPPTCSFTIKTEAVEDDYGSSEPNNYSDPFFYSLVQRSFSSDFDTDKTDNWKETSTLGSNDEGPQFGHRRDDDKSLGCSRCGTSFTCEAELKTHQKACSTQSHTCLVCRKTFQKERYLSAHMISHTCDKPYSCSQCDKCFNRRHILKNHMMTHSAEKPFPCSQCGYCFKWKVQLKHHMMTHTGEKPFSCTQCSKRFNRSDNLKTHMRIHSGEKPFSCSQCARNFTTSSNMKKHERSHRSCMSTSFEQSCSSCDM